MNQNQVTQKQEISRELFDKKVDIARAHFEYFDRLSPIEAREKAVREISSEYRVSHNQEH